MKMLEFDNGNKFISWMQQNGILKSPSCINREIGNNTVKNAGLTNRTEYNNYIAKRNGSDSYYKYQKDKWTGDEYYKQRLWNKGICEPMEFNDSCSSHKGICITEKKVAKKIIPIILGDINVEMPYGNPWFDFIVIGGIKVQVKGRKLSKRLSGSTCWKFTHIDYNNKTDYFLLIGYNDEQEEDRLKVLHVWLFHKDDIVREARFYNRDSFTITNEYKYMAEFKTYSMDNMIKNLEDIMK